MPPKIMWLGFGSLVFLIPVLVILGTLYPETYSNDYSLGTILVSSTLLATLSPFLFHLKEFKIIAWSIFTVASIANVLWFFVIRYSYIFYFSLSILAFMFIYSLFIISLPYYAVKYQGKYEQSSIRGYHIHENTYGILIILLGFTCVFIAWWWHINIELLDFLKYHLFGYFGVFSMIFGGFLLGRDYQDVKRLLFIEKQANRELDPTFNIREKFYRTSQVGLGLTLFGINMLFQSGLLGNLFLVHRDLFRIFGFILIITGAILSGLNPTYFAKKAKVL